MKNISEVLDTIFSDIDAVVTTSGTSPPNGGGPSFSGIATGFSDLDYLTAGLQKSDLIVIAGAPSIGKTSLTLGMAYGGAVGNKRTVGIFSLELSAEQTVQRFIAMESGVDTRRMQSGKIEDNEWDRISRALGRLSESPIFVHDAAYLTIETIRDRARSLQLEQGLDVIVIDSLQLISSQPRENHAQKMSELSRGLKALARELKLPVVVVSQISDAVERRIDHRPLLQDLSDCGSLDEEADLVIFIYREDRYEPDSERPGIADVIVAKHRNGPIGIINLRFFDRLARFTDLELYAGRSV